MLSRNTKMPRQRCPCPIAEQRDNVAAHDLAKCVMGDQVGAKHRLQIEKPVSGRTRIASGIGHDACKRRRERIGDVDGTAPLVAAARIADPSGDRQRQMAEEIAPTLVRPAGTDLQAYGAQLMQRFRNSALPHRTKQIAMDGTQKLPQRLLGTVRDRIAAGASCTHLALAVAGWIRYASGTDEQGRAIDVADPLAATFASIVADARSDAGPVADGFLDLKPVFGTDLVAHYAFREAVRGNVVALFRDGTRATLARHLGLA